MEFPLEYCRNCEKLALSFTNGALLTLLIKIASICAQLGFFFLIATRSNIEVVGIFAVINAGWVLSRALLPMGWNVAVLRSVARLREHGAAESIRRILIISLAETAILGIAFGFAFILAVRVLAEGYTSTAAIAIVVGLLWAEIGVIVAFLRAHGEFVWSQLCDGIVVYILPLMICGWLALTERDIELSTIVWSYLLSAILAVVSLVIVTWFRRFLELGKESSIRLDVSEERRLAHRLWWNLALSALAGRVSLFLAAPLSGFASTAIIEAGLRTQLVGATLAWAGGTVASPRYAVAHDKGQHQGGNLLNMVTWAVLLPSLGVALVLAIWGEPLLQLLGAPFAEERLAITFMAMAAVVEVPAATAGYFLMMTGRERSATLSGLVQLLSLVVLAFGLAPSLGASGIALAVLLSSAGKSCVVLIALHKGAIRSPLSFIGLVAIVDAFVGRLRRR